MDTQPEFQADNPEEQVNIGRYLRFVIAFLLIMFSALGIYEYYYGAEARKADRLQQEFLKGVEGPAAAATSSNAE